MYHHSDWVEMIPPISKGFVSHEITLLVHSIHRQHNAHAFLPARHIPATSYKVGGGGICGSQPDSNHFQPATKNQFL